MFLEGSPEARSHVGGVLPQLYGHRGVSIVLVPATLRRGGRREDRGGRLCHGCRSLGWRRSSQSRRRYLGQGLGRFRHVRGFRRAGGLAGVAVGAAVGASYSVTVDAGAATRVGACSAGTVFSPPGAGVAPEQAVRARRTIRVASRVCLCTFLAVAPKDMP